MKKIILLLLVLLITISGFAQTRADIFGNAPITWLGLDFTHLKFIGEATQFKDAGAITASDLKTKYFPGWNNLFITEQKKYDVASAVHRDNVSYAIDVTQKANDNAGQDFFTAKQDDYQLLTEDMISSLVAQYNFNGKTGIGLMFFVEGMSKDKVEASMWVTFVDMGAGKVLLTKRMTGTAGGFGLRNYWAKSIYNVLGDMGSEFKKWK